ncbi:AEC family transporter [Clostridium estertheticum]|uniref:Malate transporter n=2 Tax=Clostridium estertheticum TaxID=238834 RepID=A0A1J0GGF0_9CLOT|nr:AEC family transporter [Clostridium estertheticum]APC40441.1 malate transporter [Clostridium estertheticum subsp. estertheticum]MBU3075118.1 AEC family transporter [Clostridium estertheticum]MBU3165333.1 AEC family transporter [Clostridium estertheticum]MBU3173089.1 AEC family transporter [Clostridium estertheticum]MBZ9617738.1 AEC family transporter [Clostridium estertheticum subsp. laramiense]
MFFAADQSVLSIMIMIIIGYFLAYKKLIDEKAISLITTIVINISLPMMMLNTIVSNFTKKMLIDDSRGLIVPFLTIGCCFIIAKLFSKIVKVKNNRRGLFVSMFFNSNTIFMGLPVNLALFGEKSVPYVLLYYIANTTFFWTLGVYEITKDGNKKTLNFFSMEIIKKILSPPLIGFIVGILLVLLNIKLPLFIMDTSKSLGSITTPLSMFFIGASIYLVDLKSVKFTLDIVWVLIGRFVISPILVILIAPVFHIPHLMESVFVIQAAMPVMANSAIIARAYNSDYDFASLMIAISTVGTLIVIPILMALL